MVLENEIDTILVRKCVMQLDYIIKRQRILNKVAVPYGGVSCLILEGVVETALHFYLFRLEHLQYVFLVFKMLNSLIFVYLFLWYSF